MILPLLTPSRDNGGLEAIASVDATYRTRLETLETDTENLINRVTDMSKIADVQDANITALQDYLACSRT